MRILETTRACPQGLRVALLLEMLALPHDVRVVQQGQFLALFGKPGPRLLDDGEELLGPQAVLAHLAPRSARGLRTDDIATLDVMDGAFKSAIMAFISAAPDEKAARRDDLSRALDTLEQTLCGAATPSESPAVRAALAPLSGLFTMVGFARSTWPTLHTHLERLEASRDVTVVRARLRDAIEHSSPLARVDRSATDQTLTER